MVWLPAAAANDTVLQHAADPNGWGFVYRAHNLGSSKIYLENIGLQTTLINNIYIVSPLKSTF